MSNQMERRTFVRGIGAMTVAGALAGCSGGSGDDGDNGDDGDDGDQNTTSGGGDTSVPDDVDSYLNENNAKLYDGTAVDKTGQDTVSVTVGAGDQNLAFKPAVIRVSSGTTIEWVWGGQLSHNVVATDGTFESDQYASAGVQFSHTFENAGTFTYYCQPHRTTGMHGAVIVV